MCASPGLAWFNLATEAHPKKLESKGHASVHARVMNSTGHQPGVTHEALGRALISAFQDYHGATAEPELLDQAFLERQPSLAEKPGQVEV